MAHPLLEMIKDRKKGILCGMSSYCSANELVIEKILERAKESKKPMLIEATSNQVNQFGGYTGMKAPDFKEFVYQIADRVGCPKEWIILGGDHLGPLTWSAEPEGDAMKKAEELVRQYVLAGFTKIHLDTSMKLGDDSKDEPLMTETIAKRGVRLYQVAIDAYSEVKKENPEVLRPVFVIGSEVPIPGGAKEVEAGVDVTTSEDFEETVRTYKKAFEEYGFPDACNDVIAVVVQPGVEFGDEQVFLYNREKAKELCQKKKKYPEIVFEGHSTDYQTVKCLGQMVKDGIAILKVGPALTFGLREALFSLSMIEKEMIPKAYQSNFIEVLEESMIEEPKNWENHYHGDERAQGFARKYSYSDRSRYYVGGEEVAEAMQKLFKNLTRKEIPMSLLHQFLPIQYEKVREGILEKSPRELAKDGIGQVIDDYEFAVTIAE